MGERDFRNLRPANCDCPHPYVEHECGVGRFLWFVVCLDCGRDVGFYALPPAPPGARIQVVAV